MSQSDHAISGLRRRLMAALALRYLLAATAIWLFAWGAVVLLSRAVVGVERQPLLWGLAGAAPVIALAIAMARRRMPSAQAIRAAIDRSSAAGGLIMAESEADLGAWRDRAVAMRSPSVSFRNSRSGSIVLAAMVFVGIAFAVPQRLMQIAAARPLDVADDARRLTEQIQVLEEEQIIDQEQATNWREKLEQLRREATAEDPAKTWEALDHLKQQLTDIADKAAEDALASTEQLNQTQSLAEGVAEDQAAAESQLSNEMMKEAMAQLGQMLQRMNEQNLFSSQDMQSAGVEAAMLDPKQLANLPQLPNAAQSLKLTAEQLKQLNQIASMCQSGKLGLSEQLKKLVEAGLIDPKLLAECQSLGQCNGQGLAAFLAECEGSMSLSECLALWCASSRPGRGGITRGRGDAPMTWKDPSDPTGARFADQILPPAGLEALRDSQMIGVSIGAPQIAENVTPQSGTVLSGAEAGGGSANRQTILPRHRDAVREYFKRE